MFRSHGRHAASKHPRQSKRQRDRGPWADGYVSDSRDDETIAIFEAINKPAVAVVRQAVTTTWQRTKSIRSAQIMAAYLRSLAGVL